MAVHEGVSELIVISEMHEKPFWAVTVAVPSEDAVKIFEGTAAEVLLVLTSPSKVSSTSQLSIGQFVTAPGKSRHVTVSVTEGLIVVRTDAVEGERVQLTAGGIAGVTLIEVLQLKLPAFAVICAVFPVEGGSNCETGLSEVDVETGFIVPSVADQFIAGQFV